MNRFYINCDGIDRELFKVVETKNKNDNTFYDLNITFKGNRKTLLADPNILSLNGLLNTKNYDEYIDTDNSSHISIHCNPHKETVTIKRTISLLNGDKKTIVQVTPGIKRDKLFIPIIFRVCGNMKDESFELKNSGKCYNLDRDYTTDDNQLRFMLVLSDKDVIFHYDIEHPSNLRIYNFKNFNLTIIYSYVQIASQRQTINFTFQTNREDYEILRGFEWWEIYNQYTYLNSEYLNAYFSNDNQI